MPMHLEWDQIALRLVLTVLAGLAIGYDRSEQGKAAGLRTTLLVCVAASVAMIQVNLLLPMAGRASDSFVMNDLMRLPLGILTGVGFIGGGAILRRGDMVVGVTTASTLWLVTVIGLCFGGGQIGLGLAATGIGLLALTLLKRFEDSLPREQRASVTFTLAPDGPDEPAIRRRLRDAGLRVIDMRATIRHGGKPSRLTYELRQMRRPADNAPPEPMMALASEPGIVSMVWESKR